MWESVGVAANEKIAFQLVKKQTGSISNCTVTKITHRESTSKTQRTKRNVGRESKYILLFSHHNKC